MIRKQILKLWAVFFAGLLLLLSCAEILIHSGVGGSSSALILALVFVAVLGIVTFVCMRAAALLRSLEEATIEFARRLEQGELTARMPRFGLGQVDAVPEALNAAAISLADKHRALETSQTELKALLDSMEEAVIAISADGLVSWSNAILDQISQYPIRYGRALVHTIRDPDVLEAVSKALKSRVVCRGRATSVATGRIFQVNVAPKLGGGAVLVLHDVTQVEHAETSRRDFVANVSHELRTPLTSISGYVETLLETPGLNEAQVREFLLVVLKNASRMNRLTEDLLALARVESKDYTFYPQTIRASDLVEDAIESLAPLAHDAGLVLEAGELATSSVRADADALQQVFGNLIENAVKYGRQGGRVVVSCQGKGSGVEFSVRDFGAGIASQHLPRIFERFYRVDAARSRETGGTGLGLAIVKGIVEAHGGSVRVESEMGRGTEFLFCLPSTGGKGQAVASGEDGGYTAVAAEVRDDRS